MQKLIKRTAQAKKQLLRRAEKVSAKNKKQRITSLVEQQRFHHRNEIAQIRKAREAMREDWEMGPLAPKRDVGFDRERYGTIDSLRGRGPDLTRRDIAKEKEFMKGIYKGDRVVIVKGREMGKIGVLMDRDDKRGEAKVEGVNLVDIKMADWMLMNEQEQDKRVIRTLEKPIPYSHLRLCISLNDLEDGTVSNFTCEKVHVERKKRWVYAPDGKQIILPSRHRDPEDEEADADGVVKTTAERRAEAAEDTPADTLRLEVEEKTYVPSLLSPPIPGSVIDELRNKYSRLRTRHEPEYIAKKIQEDEDAEAKKALDRGMRTPLQEANRKERKAKKAKGKGKLTAEMLERIGAVIAQKQGRLTAGVEKVAA